MHGLSIRTKLIIAFTVVVLFSLGSLGYLNNRSTYKALTEAANEFLIERLLKIDEVGSSRALLVGFQVGFDALRLLGSRGSTVGGF